MRSEHALFTKYPLDSTVVIDGEELSSPYHIYDGELLLIGGRADAAVAAELLAGERLAPVLDSEGNALMALWVADFTEANLGPHHELQISLFAAPAPQPPAARHPFAIHRLLTLNPDVCMVCHGLWNNTQRVVRYNQAHLGLDARLSASRIDLDAGAGRLAFQVSDAESGQAVAEGAVAVPARQPPADLWRMARHLGWRGMAQAARTPFIHVPVVNTRSRYAGDNAVAHTYTRSDRQVIRLVGAADRVAIHGERYAPLAFRPDFVQHSKGIRFVYLRPQPYALAHQSGERE
jgi:hypothetical protein